MLLFKRAALLALSLVLASATGEPDSLSGSEADEAAKNHLRALNAPGPPRRAPITIVRSGPRVPVRQGTTATRTRPTPAPLARVTLMMDPNQDIVQECRDQGKKSIEVIFWGLVSGSISLISSWELYDEEGEVVFEGGPNSSYDVQTNGTLQRWYKATSCIDARNEFTFIAEQASPVMYNPYIYYDGQRFEFISYSVTYGYST